MLRLKLAQNFSMAVLRRLCTSSSSCSSPPWLQPCTPTRTCVIPLYWPNNHPPHFKLSLRAAHISPSSSASLPSYAQQDEEWDLQDLSSDPWFRSNADGLDSEGFAENLQSSSLPNADGLDSDGSAGNPPSSSWPEPDEEWYKAQAEDQEWFRREEEFYEARILQQEEWGRPAPGARPDAQPDYLALSESSLFSQCRMDTFRASGPGGQHRNKTDSGVRLTHLPTGVVAQAVDDRSQHKNRAVAMSRLRLLIAAKVRRPLKLHSYKPPPELLRLLPAEPGKKGSGDKIGVHHPDFAKGVQALLDLLAASKGYVFYAAAVLRVSPSTLSKILTVDKTVLQATNELLVSKGQKPFK